jgi:aquaporin Z
VTDSGSAGSSAKLGGVLGYLETGAEDVPHDFCDPRFEGRRLFSEVLGTFFLVLVAAGGAVVNAKSGGQIPLASG